MDISTSRLAMRPRNGWEAMDAGVRLWAEHKGLYTALWATFFLPVALAVGLLLWPWPWWAALALWWLKPVFEAPILKVLSEQVFVPLPGYRACVAATWRLLWRPRLAGDLLLPWRRLDPRRSLLLPVVVLEGIAGRDHGLRREELVRHAGGGAGWLTVFGFHLEGIFSYGLMIAAYWLWLGNPVQDALVMPADWSQVGDSLRAWDDVLLGEGSMWPYHLFNAFYALVLCVWAPIYVAAGFGLYLHARTLSEAWDIRLACRRMAARLHPPLSALLLALLLWGGGAAPSAQAEPLPEAETVAQQRQQVLQQAPFPHLAQENRYCWRSCAPTPPSATAGRAPVAGAAIPGLNLLLYGLVAALLVAALLLLWRWYRPRSVVVTTPAKAPETLFGLAIDPHSLPAEVSKEVGRLWPQDARAALSLLYRASLAQLPRHHDISLRDSDTEGEVLQRVRQQAPAALAAYWQALTPAWLQLAYAHRLPESALVADLCAAYRRHYETAAITKETA